jgi:hypothetical protein
MTPPVSLSNDLFIYHSDISKDNFLFDVTTGRIWIVDFQHIGVLPKPFQQYAFFNIGSSGASLEVCHAVCHLKLIMGT